MTRSNQRPIIIRKIDGEHAEAHHGGAWKVAYADFMTAMMAFFLLMWILSTATKDQLNGVAQYFTPATVAMTASGGTGALAGTALGPKGIRSASTGKSAPTGTGNDPQDHLAHKPQPEAIAKATAATVAAKAAMAAAALTASGTKAAHAAAASTAVPAKPAAKVSDQAALAASRALDEKHFQAVQKEIAQTMRAAPDLRPLLKNVLFQRTPDGLEIQIVDQKGRPMFANGSAVVQGATLDLMKRLGRALSKLPNKIRIAGHTDSVPYADNAAHDNWELSSNRANATRRVLIAAGVSPARISSISGLADTQPLVPSDPAAPQNRRISVLLRYVQAGSGAKRDAMPTGADAATKPPSTPAVQQTPAAKTAATPDPKAPVATNALTQQYSLITIKDLRRSLK